MSAAAALTRPTIFQSSKLKAQIGNPSPPVATVTFYTKPNCPLCDKALEQIELARREMAFDLVEVNILSDPEIYQRYKNDIPVLQINGVEAFRHRLTQADLLQKLGETQATDRP